MITATHRIITDDCRKRPDEDVISETMQSVRKAIVDALEGWPVGESTEIHVRVEIEHFDPRDQ